ncbi:MAG: hypothetical protein WCP85_31230, partial [Mariniphaga sp.]
MTFAFFLQNATAQITVTGSNTKDGPYTSLTNAGGAFEALNSITQVGKTIVITITADVTTESGTNALTGDAGMWSTLTINPSGVRTISGSSYYLIYLNGADNLTIDGLNTGGNSLTINNSSTNLDASTLYFDNDASNNVVTNCTILGSSSSSSTSATIMFGTTCPVTGNDNNNINHCNIGPSGDNLPGCALQYGGGTTEATANSGNTISYNNIYDWYSPTDSDYAIFFTSYYNNINCTITKNSFYQTAPRTKTSTSYFYSYAMYLNGPSSPSYTYGQTITDNYIGGSSPQCGGTPMSYNGAATGNVTFQPIFIKIGTATPTMIKNNTIKNISLTADGDVVLYPITVQTGACEIDNNTLGSSTATSNITLNSLTKGTKFFGIYNTGKATITSIDNNTIGGVTIDGNNGTTSYSNMFYGIYIWSTTSTIDDITNNHIGSTTIANSVSITNSTNVCRMVYIGISLSALTLGRRLVDGNTIANITIAKDATWSSVSYSSGIYSEAPDATISNNEIYNLKNGL